MGRDYIQIQSGKEETIASELALGFKVKCNQSPLDFILSELGKLLEIILYFIFLREFIIKRYSLESHSG